MTRSLTSGMQTAVASNSLKPVELVSLGFDGGAEYHTTAYKPIVHGGNTYGIGNLVGISSIKESLQLRVPTLSIALSGVNQANISTALSENAIDREIIVLRGMLDSSEVLITDPVEIFKGKLDSYQIREDFKNGTADITWSCVSHLQDFERVVGRRTNDDDQQFHFAGDLGFEFAALVARDIKWGRA